MYTYSRVSRTQFHYHKCLADKQVHNLFFYLEPSHYNILYLAEASRYNLLDQMGHIFYNH